MINLEKVSKYLSTIKDDFSSILRREPLLHNQNQLDKDNINCSKCIGHCCTFSYNSMKITPLEAIDILIYLNSKERINSGLLSLLDENIRKYRLDKFISDGRGREIRRYYTCPFFKDQNLGCSIGLDYKPYGCISFNPTRPDTFDEDKCNQNLDLLIKRENQFDEVEKIELLRIIRAFKIEWKSRPISTALKDLLERIDQC